jgi:hypothetical protein
MVVLAAMLAAAGSADAAGPALAGKQSRPVGEAEGIFTYRFERGDLRYGDLLTLRDGSKRLGKVVAWANEVLLFEADGRPVVFDVDDVEQFEFRRARRHRERPDLPDLTVAYVERWPRDQSWHGHVVSRDGLEVLDADVAPGSGRPAGGSAVTLRIHVLNAGGAAAGEAGIRVLIDGVEAKAATIPPLEPGRQHIVEASWSWQEGRHTLRVELDPEGTSPEIVRWNNTFVEMTDALPVAVVVAADRYEAFRGLANIVDSFCFEDWIQYQIRVMNGLFAASVSPSSPDGIQERLRCDRIMVVDDPMAPEQRGQWEKALRQGGHPDGPVEVAALWVLGRLAEDEALGYDALKVDWDGLQRLGGEIGLIDPGATDTTIEQCFVLDQRRRYAQRRHLFPLRRTMMCTAGPFTFDERSAAHLNRVLGQPRGCRGSYQYQLPGKTTIEVRSNVGTPLADVQVDAFQLIVEGEYAGAIGGYGREDPLYSAVTGADGRLTLLDLPAGPHKAPDGYTLRPNPFGKIAPDGSNGLLLLRLRHGGREEFHFLRLYDCNLAYLRGHTEEYVRLLDTRFGAPGAPASPPYAAVLMDDRTGPEPRMTLRWPMPPEIRSDSIEEFRVYRRTSFAGDGAKPWSLVATARRNGKHLLRRVEGAYFEEFHCDALYSLDTFFAVSTVDRQGRESGLSQTGYLAYDKDSLKLAMDSEAAYITLTGDGPCQMIRWDGVAGMQPYGARSRRVKGYTPSFAGIARAVDGRLIVTDPVNHVLAFYDHGDLVELVPDRKWWPGFPSDEPGEFYAPADVAAGGVGDLYVADRLNNRVQVLDSRGRFKTMVDEDFRFVEPHAVACANGHLCVTDDDGTRCRVYEVGSGGVKFVRQLPLLEGADRGLVGKSGKVYITGRDAQADASGVLVYDPQGEGATFVDVGTEGIMGKYHRPRGMTLYRSGHVDYAYFVNDFPFEVRRYKIP